MTNNNYILFMKIVIQFRLTHFYVLLFYLFKNQYNVSTQLRVSSCTYVVDFINLSLDIVFMSVIDCRKSFGFCNLTNTIPQFKL